MPPSTGLIDLTNSPTLTQKKSPLFESPGDAIDMTNESAKQSTAMWRPNYACQPPLEEALKDWQGFLSRHGMKPHPKHEVVGSRALAIRNAVLSAAFRELRVTHAVPPKTLDLQQSHMWEIYAGLSDQLPEGIDGPTMTQVIEWFFDVIATERQGVALQA